MTYLATSIRKKIMKGGPAYAGPGLLRRYLRSKKTITKQIGTTAIGLRPILPSAKINPVTAMIRFDSRSEPFSKVSIDTSFKVLPVS